MLSTARSLRVLLFCLLLVALGGGGRRARAQLQPSGDWLSKSIGYPPSEGLFPDAARATLYCVDPPNNDKGVLPLECVPAPINASLCLSRAELEEAFSRAPNVLESLYARFDIRVSLSTQADDSSVMLDHVLRLLLTEVGGYSVTHIWTPNFTVQLPRCVARQVDFSSEVWSTDYTEDEWQAAFFGDPETATCELVGVNGLLGQNGWYVDARSVAKEVAETPPGRQVVALDFWRSYATEDGIKGLQRFDPDQVIPDELAGKGIWFVPPACQNGSICGTGYGWSMFFEPGTPQQQIVNLGWKIALFFPSSTDLFTALLDEQIALGKQVLLMASNTMAYVAGTTFVRVALPPSELACNVDPYVNMNGEGPMKCDFPSQSLFKLRAVNPNTDLLDAQLLFQHVQFPTDAMTALLATVKDGMAPPDAACLWVRNNTQSWSSWFRPTTPRKFIARLAEHSATAIYALLSFYLLVSLLAHGYLYRHRKHVVIRRSSHLFLQAIIAGASCFYVTLFVGMQDDSHMPAYTGFVPEEHASGSALATAKGEGDGKLVCTLSQFLLSLSFSLFYVSLLTKTYRIYAIFTTQQLRMLKLTDAVMFGYLAAYMFLDLLLVALWAIIDAPEAALVPHSSLAFGYVSKCTSSKGDVFKGLLYVLRGAALLFGAFLAVRISGRLSDSDYDESKYLAVITYNICIILAIVVGVQAVGSNAPEVVEGSWMAGVSLAVFFSLVVLLAPKVINVWRNPNGAVRSGPGGTGAAGGTAATGAQQLNANANATQAMMTANNCDDMVPLASRMPGSGGSGGSSGRPGALHSNMGRSTRALVPNPAVSTVSSSASSPVVAAPVARPMPLARAPSTIALMQQQQQQQQVQQQRSPRIDADEIDVDVPPPGSTPPGSPPRAS